MILRALHGHATGTERDGSGLAAVPDSRALDVVTALRADHVDDLFGHQSFNTPRQTPIERASSASFAAPARSPSASCTRAGSA